jgi:peptidoglycan/LPS O-acetylase OafA/YrhL
MAPSCNRPDVLKTGPDRICKPRLSGHLPALDGTRGIAVIWVFLFHAGVPGFSGGFIGVDVFFVLSGFLISSLLIQEYQANRKIRFKNFYMRRVLRLFPALFLLMTVFVVFVWFFFKTPEEKLFHLQDALITMFYAANWTRAFDLYRPVILAHCWSLSIEEQFYLVWPAILLCLLKLPGVWRSVSIAVLLFLSWAWRLVLLEQHASWYRLYNGFDTRADMLLAGCLLASLWHAGNLDVWQKSSPWVRHLILVPAVFFLLSGAMWFDWQKPALYQYQYTAIGLATGVILLELISFEAGPLARVLRIRPLQWMGMVSYGFYLWHYPVMHVLQTVTELKKPLFVLCAGSLTLLFTVISWYGVEQVFQKYKKRYKISPSRELQPSVS